jgi:hypothetical protein
MRVRANQRLDVNAAFELEDCRNPAENPNEAFIDPLQPPAKDPREGPERAKSSTPS